jgi:hypothetical protein
MSSSGPTSDGQTSDGRMSDSDEDDYKSSQSMSKRKKKRVRLTKSSNGSEAPNPSDTEGIATTVGTSSAGEDSGESEVENGNRGLNKDGTRNENKVSDVDLFGLFLHADLGKHQPAACQRNNKRPSPLRQGRIRSPSFQANRCEGLVLQVLSVSRLLYHLSFIS